MNKKEQDLSIKNKFPMFLNTDFLVHWNCTKQS